MERDRFDLVSVIFIASQTSSRALESRWHFHLEMQPGFFSAAVIFMNPPFVRAKWEEILNLRAADESRGGF